MQAASKVAVRLISFPNPVNGSRRLDPATEIHLCRAPVFSSEEGVSSLRLPSAALPQTDSLQPSSRPLALQIGNDLQLLNSRTPLLEMAGFAVQSCCGTLSEATSEAMAPRLAALVLCQSLRAGDASRRAKEILRMNDRVFLIRFSKYPWDEMIEPEYHEILQSPTPPAAFVETMVRLRAGTGMANSRTHYSLDGADAA